MESWRDGMRVVLEYDNGEIWGQHQLFPLNAEPAWRKGWRGAGK